MTVLYALLGSPRNAITSSTRTYSRKTVYVVQLKIIASTKVMDTSRFESLSGTLFLVFMAKIRILWRERCVHFAFDPGTSEPSRALLRCRTFSCILLIPRLSYNSSRPRIVVRKMVMSRSLPPSVRPASQHVQKISVSQIDRLGFETDNPSEGEARGCAIHDVDVMCSTLCVRSFQCARFNTTNLS